MLTSASSPLPPEITTYPPSKFKKLPKLRKNQSIWNYYEETAKSKITSPSVVIPSVSFSARLLVSSAVRQKLQDYSPNSFGYDLTQDNILNSNQSVFNTPTTSCFCAKYILKSYTI